MRGTAIPPAGFAPLALAHMALSTIEGAALLGSADASENCLLL